ncbi:MAG: hypothetical protein M0Z55_13705 [Peptococcaceae bacterium]|nr:hypothetical protein [Peptococcaceae bacterium]
MALFSDNRDSLTRNFEKRGDGMTVSVRDVAGWILVVSLLLAIGAWRLNWIGDLVTGFLSIALLASFVIAVAAYPISQIIHRGEPRADHLYAEFKKQ